MKKILTGLLLSSVIAAPVLANAGPKVRPQAPCPGAPYVKWGGFKMGIQFGWGHGKSHNTRTSTNLNTGQITFKSNSNVGFKGVVGGFHGGYDHQFLKNWIIGVDLSMDFQHFESEERTTDAQGNRWVGEFKSKYTFAVVPRIGYGIRDSLVYAGFGWASTSARDRGKAFGRFFNKEKNANGVRFAVGAAQRLNRILMGVEGTYDVFDSAGRRIRVATDNGTESIKVSVKPRVLEAKIRLSYLM